MSKPVQPQPATRAAILDNLKRQGELSAAILGDMLGLTAMAVRLQLYDLREEGLVTERAEAAGRGRPVKYWRLTEKASEVFPDAHQALAVDLINSVEKVFGPEGLARIIDTHSATQRTAYKALLKSARTPADRVKKLAKARADEGYMAEARKDGRDWLLIENHCPICSAAKACTGLCANELKVFQDVLGKDVQVAREEHILEGARRCAYRIKSKSNQ